MPHAWCRLGFGAASEVFAISFMSNPAIDSVNRLPGLVCRLYSLVAEFEALFPGRKFTPDGHLVGSIGEVIAAHRYDLLLSPASSAAHDGTAKDGTEVEIKVTQGTSVAFRAEAQHVIVLHLSRNGQAIEIFNGPGSLVWANCGAMQRNGQRSISLSKLTRLMEQVGLSRRLAARNETLFE